MERRKLLASFALVTSLSGCVDIIKKSEPSSSSQYPMVEETQFEEPMVEIQDLSYDWQTGVSTIMIYTELNSAESIQLSKTGERIDQTGVSIIETKNLPMSNMTYTFLESGLEERRYIDFDDINLDFVKQINQLRFLSVNVTNGIKKTEFENSEIKKQNFDWGKYSFKLQIPKSLYKYYKDRHRVPEYGAYGADPFDKSVMTEIVEQFNKMGNSKQEIIAELLNFVQSMEYTQDKAATGYNEYPKFPVETIFEDGGDCEDTTILLAAILKEMGYGVRLLLLDEDNHMALGLAGDESVDGTYYLKDGTRYYYVETTGANWRIGEKPPNVKGEQAYLKKITGHPTLRGLINNDGFTQGGAPKHKIRIDNLTDFKAKSVYAVVNYKNQEKQTIRSDKIFIGDLQGKETAEKTIWFAPPPVDTKFKLEMNIYEDNSLHDKMISPLVGTEY